MSRRRSKSRSSSTLRWLTIIVVIVLVGYFVYREFGIGAKIDSSANGPVLRIDLPTNGPNQPSQLATPASSPDGQPTLVSSQNTAGWYDLYFTTPRYPDKPGYHHGGLDTQLAAFINSAQKTIDMADYDFDLENVANALAKAAARGVRVRMVTDTDTLTNDDPKVQKAFDILKQAKIPIVDDQRGPIMHNKFMVVDSAAVWTG